MRFFTSSVKTQLLVLLVTEKGLKGSRDILLWLLCNYLISGAKKGD